MFSASLGIARGFEDPKNSSAESAIHLRHKLIGLLDRSALSALVYSAICMPWGDAPGSVEMAPLALTRDSFPKGERTVGLASQSRHVRNLSPRASPS